MKNVIDQIAAIDAVAYENEQKNKSIISIKRRQYENEIKKYREQKLKQAKNSADSLYGQIIGNARAELREKEEEMKRKTEQIEKNYKKLERKIIKDIFDRLFNQ